MHKTKLTIFLTVISLALFGMAGVASAAPAVTGIAGTLTNGSVITVTGTGFGANGPIIKLYDEFESGTVGNVISLTAGSATINEWSVSNGSGLTTYSNEWPHSGTKSMKNNWDSPSGEPGNQMGLDFSDTTEIFYSFWTMVPTGKLLPGDPAGGGPVVNWKFSWLWGGNFGNAHADEYFSPAIPGQQFSSPYTLWFTYNTSQGRVTGGERGDHMSKGEWSRIDHYIKGGATNGILHAVETDATHGIVTKVNQTNVFTLENGYAWNHLTIPGYGKGQTTNGVTVYDDVYVATGPGARARVEIGDASTYATSKNLSIATVTSWNDTSVQATLRQGSLADINGAYLYVIDANGNVNANGYLLTPTPAITGISSGVITNGSAVTVTGTGFGTKTTVAPWRWDPIEGVSQYSALNNGDTIPYSSGGYWDMNSSNLFKYNTVTGNQRGLSTANAATVVSNSLDIKLGTTLASASFSNETYASYWIWHSTTLTSADNTKTIRYWDANGPGTYRFSLQDSWTANGPWNLHRYDNGLYCFDSGVLPGNFVRPIGGEWERVELYLKQETTPDTSNDGEVWVAQTANGAISSYSKVNFDESCSGFTGRLRWMTFGYDNNNASQSMGLMLDDIYIDNTRARIELGDASTWSSNTHREIQVPSAWTINSITLTVNQGTFANGQTAYLYVIDKDGNVNQNGYPVVVGLVSDTTPPSAPQGLMVNVKVRTPVPLEVSLQSSSKTGEQKTGGV